MKNVAAVSPGTMGEAYRLLPVCVGVRTLRRCASWEDAPGVLAGPGQNPGLSAW